MGVSLSYHRSRSEALKTAPRRVVVKARRCGRWCRRNRYRLALALAAVMALVALWSAVYLGRVDDRANLLEGCGRGIERSKTDIAQDGDLSTVVSAERRAEVLKRRAEAKERIAGLDCAEEYPPPSVWPWGG